MRVLTDWKENRKVRGLFMRDCKFTIRELIDGFNEDIETNEVTSMNGRLNIRPKYQREFVYKMEQQESVIETVLEDFSIKEITLHCHRDMNDPTNEDLFKYDLMDGQQRLISICNFYKNKVEYHDPLDDFTRKFVNLPPSDKEAFMNFEIHAEIYDGSLGDILRYFKRLNIAGEVMNNQELRNAIASIGRFDWIQRVKEYFSRVGRGANDPSRGYTQYFNATMDDIKHQKVLEMAIRWHANKMAEEYELSSDKVKRLDDYVVHCTDFYDGGSELIEYFEGVLNWVDTMFVGEDNQNYRDIMKTIDWGTLYNTYHDSCEVEPTVAQALVNKMFNDPNLDLHTAKAKRGVYAYVLTCTKDGTMGDLQTLHMRLFDRAMVINKWAKNDYRCKVCGKLISQENLEGHHIKAWYEGGTSDEDNCLAVCKACHTELTNEQNARWEKQKDFERKSKMERIKRE